MRIFPQALRTLMENLGSQGNVEMPGEILDPQTARYVVPILPGLTAEWDVDFTTVTGIAAGNLTPAFLDLRGDTEHLVLVPFFRVLYSAGTANIDMQLFVRDRNEIRSIEYDFWQNVPPTQDLPARTNFEVNLNSVFPSIMRQGGLPPIIIPPDHYFNINFEAPGVGGVVTMQHLAVRIDRSAWLP